MRSESAGGAADKPLAYIFTSVFLRPESGGYFEGGSVRWCRDLAGCLVKAGFEVRVVQKGPSNSVTVSPDGVSVRFLKMPVRTWTDPLFAFQTRKLAREASLCVYGTAELALPFYAKRALAIQHGIWWDVPRKSIWSGHISRAFHWVRNVAWCRRMQAVICVDTNFINYLRTNGAPAAIVRKCRYVPNYANIPAPHASSDFILRRRFRERRLLFLRRFEAHRGPDLFVDACRVLKSRGLNFSAVMAGSGALKNQTQTRIEQNGLRDIIRIKESGLDEVYPMIDASAVSIVPSLWSEGTSLSAAESLAMGVPVIATDVGGLGNLVVPHFNGLLVNADAKSLADAIERMLSNEEAYIAIARNCLQLREALSFQRWQASILDILNSAGLLPESSASRMDQPEAASVTVA
jgi:glycosyltransferase involved in cell wall biosynthesis